MFSQKLTLEPLPLMFKLPAALKSIEAKIISSPVAVCSVPLADKLIETARESCPLADNDPIELRARARMSLGVPSVVSVPVEDNGTD